MFRPWVWEHSCCGCSCCGFRDAQAMGVGMLRPWMPGCSRHGCQACSGHGSRDTHADPHLPFATTCVRLPQLRRPQHGGTHCQPLGAAHRNRTHGLSMHHTSTAVRVPGTSLSSLPVPLGLFLLFPLNVLFQVRFPFPVQFSCIPQLHDHQHLLSAPSP